jgi:hypothetical protein
MKNGMKWKRGKKRREKKRIAQKKESEYED